MEFRSPDEGEEPISDERWAAYFSLDYEGRCPKCDSKAGRSKVGLSEAELRSNAQLRSKHARLMHNVSKRSINKRKDDPKDPLVTCHYHPPDHQCRMSNLSRCRKKAFEKYIIRCKGHLDKARERLKENIKGSKKHTRIHENSKCMSKCMSTLELGEPITKRDYIRGNWEEGSNKFVICSREEAQEILRETGPPRLPILILPIPNDVVGRRKLIRYYHKLIRRIKSGPPLHVFDYSKDANNHDPELMPAAETMQQYELGKGPVLNILNIPMDPEEEDWMGEIEGFNLVSELYEEAKERGVDLSCLLKAIRVSLVATPDAMSLDHIDKHGFITRLKLWSGYKFWNIACEKHRKMLEEVVKSGEYSGKRFTIFLEAGCELIQPAGTLHSVLSHEENAITSCFMYWHPSMIQDILDQTFFEIHNPDITNDAHVSCFVQAMEILFDFWEDGKPGFPDIEEMPKAEDTLEMIKNELSQAKACPRSNPGTQAASTPTTAAARAAASTSAAIAGASNGLPIPAVRPRDPPVKRGRTEDGHQPNSTGHASEGMLSTPHHPPTSLPPPPPPGAYPDNPPRHMNYQGAPYMPPTLGDYRAPSFLPPTSVHHQTPYEQHGGYPSISHEPFYSVYSSSGPAKKKNNRASQACDSCRHLKAKCDEMKPCRTCKEKGVECKYRDPVPKATDKAQADILEGLGSVQTLLNSIMSHLGRFNQRLTNVESLLYQHIATLTPTTEPSADDEYK
ncbi:Zn(2)-C6 fungal-type DNA-binding domain, partial [Fusarium oxysporum f. sp. vasinfectum]